MNHKTARWTDSFINHPKWAFVFCALIVLLGYQAMDRLQVRRFPATETGQITIQASYPGASAELMQTRVTQPLQRAIAAAEGIDYQASSTQDSFVSIEARLKVGASVDQAFNTILAQVQSANSQLPSDMDAPVISKGSGNNIALLYVAYAFSNSSGEENSSELYHYLNTVVRPQLATVPGISDINILGARPPAIRIWLDPLALQQHQITPSQVAQMLTSQNFSLPSGVLESGEFRQPLRLTTQIDDLEVLRELPISNHQGQLVVLGDLARLELGSENDDAIVLFNDQVGVFLSASALPGANATEVIQATRARLESLESQLPAQMSQTIVYDATLFIEDSINEVISTIIEASVIVVAVVYLFLGSVRAMLIPILAIPLSLLGMIALMPSLSMSLNLLTLLAMILAIGLVVDDAILVVEHYVTVRKERYPSEPFTAAKVAISELQAPLIITTLVLVLAFSPLIFLQGLTGALFREFALTLAGAVVISGFVALLVSPVMCAELFQNAPSIPEPRWLLRLKESYAHNLEQFFSHQKLVGGFLFFIGALSAGLMSYMPEELAPAEDQGFALLSYRGPNNASLSYLEKHARPLNDMLRDYPITENYFLIHGAGGSTASGFGGIIAQPWSERSLSMQQAGQELQEKFRSIVPLEIFSFTPSSLPSPDGLPFQWVLYGPVSFEQLYEKSQQLIEELSQTGYFPFISTNFQFRKMNYLADIDRSLLNSAESNLRDLSQNVMLSLTDAPVAQFLYKGESIDCILRLQERPREIVTESWPIGYDSQGQHKTLADFSSFSWEAEPNVRPMFNQMPSITIQGALYPTADLNYLIAKTTALSQELANDGLFSDYTGPTRSYIQEQGQLVSIAIIAVFVIYLALLALYETWLDPLLILVTVPLALSGALGAMLLSTMIPFITSVTLNIYTQLGLLTLLGLITKHGILLVQLAGEERAGRPDLGFKDAMTLAAHSRFRPIIMTTGATVVGVLPLLIASGPGAVSRFHLGFVLSFGLCIGTLFTIFLLPVFYTMAHEFFDRRSAQSHAHRLDHS